MGPSACLDVLETRKISCHGLDTNPGCPARILVTTQICRPASKGSTISEYRNGKDVEEIDHGLICGATSELTGGTHENNAGLCYLGLEKN